MIEIQLDGLKEVEIFEKIVLRINELGVEKVFELIKESVDPSNTDTGNSYRLNYNTLGIKEE